MDNTDAQDLADLATAFGESAATPAPADGEAPKDPGGETSPAPSPPSHEATPPGTDEPTTQEAAPETPPEPEKPRETKLFSQALKIREEANRKAAEADAKAAAVEARERALAEREERWKRIDEDPLSYFELSGKDPHDFARLLMQTPEERAKATPPKPSPEIEAIKAEVARLKEEREQERQQLLNGTVSVKKREFASFVVQNAKDYPDLAAEDDADIGAAMWDIAAQHFNNTGELPDLAAVAAHLQEAKAEERAKREERRAKRLGLPPQPSATLRSQTPHQPANGHPASPGPRSVTLTNSAATERASAPRELTKEEQDKLDLEELRRSLYA